MYQDKLTELLRLFIAQQWSRWIEDEAIFPEFIDSLFNFTFDSYAPLPFTEKLIIWHPIINGLASRGFGRYTQVMHLLVSGILQKIQLRIDVHDRNELKDLNTECLDDDVSNYFKVAVGFAQFTYAQCALLSLSFPWALPLTFTPLIITESHGLATLFNSMY